MCSLVKGSKHQIQLELKKGGIVLDSGKTGKLPKVLLCAAIVVLFVSMIGASLVQSDFGSVQIKDLSIMTDAGWTMSAELFIPSNATADNPAPAIVTSHGNYNNKEMQDANFVELSRRGYVVLSIDNANHGNSDGIKDSNDMMAAFTGVYQGVLAVSRMPFVDTSRIGVTGHSAGGNSCNAAVKLDNESETPLIAAVLLNCSDATYVDENGAFYNGFYGSRDVGIISAQYDEFFHYVKDDAGNVLHFSPYFMNTAKAQSFLHFGVDPTGLDNCEADKIYHQDVDGKDAIRVIYRPKIIHPWSHFSARSTADVIAFFDEAFTAPRSLAPTNQVWQWKEAFNALGIVGLCMFMTAFAILMSHSPYFAAIRCRDEVEPAVVGTRKGKIWFWGSLGAGALFATLIYFPVVAWGTRQELLVLQPESFGLGLWSACCGLFTILSMVVYYKVYGKKNGFDLRAKGILLPLTTIGKTILLAVIVAVVTYAWVFFAQYFFQVDFRLWTLAFKTFNSEKVFVALFPYLELFLLYYVPASISANCFNYNEIGGKKGFGNATIVAVFTALPAFILPWMQYGYYYATDRLLFWGTTNRMHMYCLWLFPILLILMGATYISRAIYKKTGNPYLAGIVNAIIVTLITVINTRMYYLGY